MKLSNLLLFAGAAAGSYLVTKNRQTITDEVLNTTCLLYTSPSPRDATLSRMPSSA